MGTHLPVETLLLLAGFVAGGVAAFLAWRVRRSPAAAFAWGLFVASIPWIGRFSYLSNQADEMAGIPYALVAGLLFWFVTVPTGVILARSHLRTRARRRERDPGHPG
jgi:hypothetical protein